MGSPTGLVARLKKQHAETDKAIASLKPHTHNDVRRKELKRERLKIKERLVALGARIA